MNEAKKLRTLVKKYRIFIIGGIIIIISFLPVLIFTLINLAFRPDQYHATKAIDFLLGTNFIILLAGFLIVTMSVLMVSIIHAKKYGLAGSPKENLNYDTIKPSKTLIEASQPSSSTEYTYLSKKFHSTVDLFDWETNEQKTSFIKEMMSLSPKEREDILNYMYEMEYKEQEKTR